VVKHICLPAHRISLRCLLRYASIVSHVIFSFYIPRYLVNVSRPFAGIQASVRSTTTIDRLLDQPHAKLHVVQESIHSSPSLRDHLLQGSCLPDKRPGMDVWFFLAPKHKKTEFLVPDSTRTSRVHIAEC